MLDLIQLISMQLTAAEKSTSLQQEEPAILNPGQDEVAFIALMTELLGKEPASPQRLFYNLQALNLNPDEPEETKPIELQIESQIESIDTNELIPSHDSSEIKKTEGNEKDINDLEESTLPFAWFKASSFEPPNAERFNGMEEESESLSRLTLNSEIANETIPSTRVLNNNPKVEAVPLSTIPSLFTETQAEPPARTQESLVQEAVYKETLKLATDRKETIPEKSETGAYEGIDEALLFSSDAEVARFKTESNDNFFDSTLIKPPNSTTTIKRSPVEITTPAIPMHSGNDLKIPTNEIAPKLLHLTQAVSDAEWGENFNQQILWLGQQKIKSAVIKLNPQELGPLEVNIKLVKDVASVNITTHTTQVRDLIEQSLPRLREMMSEQGVNLSQVNIESNSHQRNPSTQTYEATTSEPENNEEPLLLTSLTPPHNKGIVDYFA
ncbi:hypothetical protein A8135_08440 [Legionella jamestowniensis]|uniref:Flagellar hook-length control protein-like C-terminal domain-containing protein n=1 Tax=Legionella jamestowniensis TaxID=455 RepID=A0ABX2XXA1_9GAMM|nr:flagellar hook-length control protein FliK [Legionella jamestowniensis]OCH99262.1 hypothetical protein A8135_08440 [Legionella jamestowniensis]